jgi:hypothetical protein
MIIGVKYWAYGDTPPAGWTNIDVLECYARPRRKSFLRGEGIDGVQLNFRRKFLVAHVLLAPNVMATPASRAIAEAMADAYYIRIKDTRYSDLGDANTIDLIHAGDTEPGRDAPTLLAEEMAFELISEVPL